MCFSSGSALAGQWEEGSDEVQDGHVPPTFLASLLQQGGRLDISKRRPEPDDLAFTCDTM